MSTTFKKDQGGTQQARDMAGQAADKTKEVAGQVSDTVQHAAQAAGQKAEDATAAVGSGIQSVAAKVREQGPNTGMLGSATQTVAGAIDETGRYLQDKNLSGMMDDMTGLIKRNPIPAVLIGLGVGFLIGRVLSSSTRS
jgi:ElaB/YqjD/DUF883 family membrane-anchored ribosome-binding protein